MFIKIVCLSGKVVNIPPNTLIFPRFLNVFEQKVIFDESAKFYLREMLPT